MTEFICKAVIDGLDSEIYKNTQNRLYAKNVNGMMSFQTKKGQAHLQSLIDKANKVPPPATDDNSQEDDPDDDSIFLI